MMKIRLEKLQKDDVNKLYDFEIENRVYLEKMVPSRGVSVASDLSNKELSFRLIERDTV